ncbi:MAG: hypothetical protein ACREV7_14955 [Steroidobacteraceae bacterium]
MYSFKLRFLASFSDPRHLYGRISHAETPRSYRPSSAYHALLMAVETRVFLVIDAFFGNFWHAACF